MELLDKIKDLIPLLDNYEDSLIVNLLNSKINEVKDLPIGLNDNEIKLAENGIKRTLESFYNKLDTKTKRMECVIPSCDECKYSIKKSDSYGLMGATHEFTCDSMDDNSAICQSCSNRCNIIQDEISKRNNIRINNINETINNNRNLVELKTIINKCNKKLSDIRAKNKELIYNKYNEEQLEIRNKQSVIDFTLNTGLRNGDVLVDVDGCRYKVKDINRHGLSYVYLITKKGTIQDRGRYLDRLDIKYIEYNNNLK